MPRTSHQSPDRIQVKLGTLLLLLLALSACLNTIKQQTGTAPPSQPSAGNKSHTRPKAVSSSPSPPSTPASDSQSALSSSIAARESTSAARSSASLPPKPSPNAPFASSSNPTVKPSASAASPSPDDASSTTTDSSASAVSPSPDDASSTTTNLSASAASPSPAPSGSVLPSTAQHSAPTTADVEQIEVVVRARRMHSVLQTAVGKEAIEAIECLLGERSGGKHTIESDIKRMISGWALQLSYVPDVDQKTFEDIVMGTLADFKKTFQAAYDSDRLQRERPFEALFYFQKRRLYKKLYTLLIAAGTNKDARRLSSHRHSKASSSVAADIEQETKAVVQRMNSALQKADGKTAIAAIKAIETALQENASAGHTVALDTEQLIRDLAQQLSDAPDVDQKRFYAIVNVKLNAYKQKFKAAFSEGLCAQLKVWYSELYTILLKASGVTIATSLKVQHIDIATEVAENNIALKMQEALQKEEVKKVIEKIEQVLKEYLGEKHTIESAIQDIVRNLARQLSRVPDIDQPTLDYIVTVDIKHYEEAFQKELSSGTLQPQKSFEEVFYVQLEKFYKQLYAIILAAGADTMPCQLASLVPSTAQRVDTATEIAHIKAAVKGRKERMRSALQSADGKKAVEEIESILKEYLGEEYTTTELDTKQIISDLALQLSYTPKVDPKRIAAIVNAKLDAYEERFQKALSSGTLQPQKALGEAFYTELEIWYTELYTILLKTGGATVARSPATNPLLLK